MYATAFFVLFQWQFLQRINKPRNKKIKLPSINLTNGKLKINKILKNYYEIKPEGIIHRLFLP